jgi:hypothetical protein
MPPYSRYRGERVIYSRRDTQIYMSQRIRWLKGQRRLPSETIFNDDGTRVFRFRTYRAEDGFWETVFDPEGYIPGEEGNPGGGGSGPVCGVVSGQCLSNRLLYSKVRQIVSGLKSCPTSDSSSGSRSVTPYESVYDYYMFPASGAYPPNPGIVPVFGTGGTFYDGPYPEGCIHGTLSAGTVSTSDFTLGFLALFQYSPSADRVIRYVIASGTLSNGPTRGFPDGGGTLNDPCSYGPSMGSYTAQLFFEDGSVINDHSSCLPGSPGLPPGSGTPGTVRPLRYRCNCPDFTKYVEGLSWSRYPSELVGRTIVGRTHSGDDGPCKHVYSAAIAAGEPFRDPGTVRDPWTFQNPPTIEVVSNWDDQVPPVDLDNMQVMEWRERMRQRERDYYERTVSDERFRFDSDAQAWQEYRRDLAEYNRLRSEAFERIRRGDFSGDMPDDFQRPQPPERSIY